MEFELDREESLQISCNVFDRAWVRMQMPDRGYQVEMTARTGSRILVGGGEVN